MRILLGVLAVALVALSSLTAFEIPRWVNWRLGLLAGEYGHWLAFASLGVAVGASCLRLPRPWLVVVWVLATIAAGFALKPAIQAWTIGRSLAEQFHRAFPRHPDTGSTGFELRRLFTTGPTLVAPRTLAVPGGQPLDFYPARGRANAPCVVMVHGGGWDSGDKAQLPQFNAALTTMGYAVAAVSYRLAPAATWPAPREDVLAAIRFLENHGRELGIDGRCLVLCGRSAGGHIAATTAYTAGDPAIRGVITLYAPADLEFAWTCGKIDKVLDSPALMRQLIGRSYPEAPEAFRDASAYFHIGPACPPTLLIHGDLDPIVWRRQSERLAQKLGEQHVPHVLLSLPWATHACEYNVHGPSGQLTLSAVKQFLAAVTGPR